ncbi:MAG: tRNA nucleotidyltransferase [Bacillales bacterium]|nr:tRNA nucleotidyltransferase [Bacillales bacterium]
MTNLFEQAKPIIKTLKQNGYEAYFVGGSVRDFVMGRDINDIDIATSAFPDEVKAVFERTIDIGIQHGTVLVLSGEDKYEITTFRTESTYSDFRRPDSVQFVRSLLEDLKRRDFTMNALAMDENGKVYDYFEGKIDIENKVIRAVGIPSLRFNEDALRMLRAIRFQSQLGFQIEEGTLLAIKQNAENLNYISQERITIEFEKILMGKHSNLALQSLVESGLASCLQELSNFHNSLTRVNFDTLETIEEKWAKLFIELKIDPKLFLVKWKCSSEKICKVKSLVNCHYDVLNSGWTNRILFNYGLETSLSVEKLKLGRDSNRAYIEGLFQKLNLKSKQDLAIRGQDLIGWTNQKGGPWLGEMIEKITDEVLNGYLVNDKEKIKEWVLSNMI